MTPEQRRNFIRWFCLLAPTVGVVMVVGFRVLEGARPASGVSESFEEVFAITHFGLMQIGWYVLILGCSITLALDLLRERGKQGIPLAIYVALLTPAIAFSHYFIGMVVLFGGCVAMQNGGLLH